MGLIFETHDQSQEPLHHKKQTCKIHEAKSPIIQNLKTKQIVIKKD